MVAALKRSCAECVVRAVVSRKGKTFKMALKVK